jgi:hypothetical protein
MAEIDASKLVSMMLEAAARSLDKKWPEAKQYAESEFKKITESILFIQKEVRAKRMTHERAKLHLQMQKNSTQMILLTLEGLGILAVEQAIHAALSAVTAPVNKALGFALL